MMLLVRDAVASLSGGDRAKRARGTLTLAAAEDHAMSVVEAATPLASGTLRAVLNGVNHLSRWRGRTVVIKYGGAAMERSDLRASFAQDVVRLRSAGIRPVIVHGGGPQIDTLMRRLGKTPCFVSGLRVTDEETMELVEMVLMGRINPELVGLINRHGGRAIGLNGKDADLLVAHRRPQRLAVRRARGSGIRG
jgi:acetylglutamate kinase